MTSTPRRVDLEGLSRALAPWTVALPGLVVLALSSASFGLDLVDDAYISLTYARNLASGHGLVFHPLLSPTEGYSNLLWTLMLAIGLKLGFSGAVLAGGLGWLLSAATLAILARRIGGIRGVGVGVALALSPIFSYWASRGLEGGLVSLLLLTAILRLGTRSSWLCFGLLGVTRVEGLVWGGLGLLHALLRRRWRPDARAAALWLAPSLLQFGFRGLYYGALTPAPLIAKGRSLDATTLKHGLSWLSGALTGEPILSVTLLLVIVLWARALARREPLDRAPWAVLSAAGLVLFGIAVGGDWMPNLRWLMPAVPLVWLAANELIPTNGQLGVLVGLSMIIGAQTGQISQGGDSNPRRWPAAVEVVMRGPPPARIHPATLFVLEHLSEDEPVVQPDVGMLSWLTNNPIMDPQGLTWRDAAIAQSTPPGTTEHTEAVKRVGADIRALKPALLGLTVNGERAAGPAAEALLGSRTGHPPASWFAEGWTLWRDETYSPGVSIRYYLRNDITDRLTPRARLKRYEAALERSPDASLLNARVSWTLRQLGRDDEARAIDAALDPRDRRSGEVWSR